jgi:hypothetical protein
MHVEKLRGWNPSYESARQHSANGIEAKSEPQNSASGIEAHTGDDLDRD